MKNKSFILLIFFILVLVFFSSSVSTAFEEEPYDIEVENNNPGIAIATEEETQSNNEEIVFNSLRAGIISRYSQINHLITEKFIQSIYPELSGDKTAYYTDDGFVLGLYAQYFLQSIPLYFNLDFGLSLTEVITVKMEDNLLRRYELDGTVLLANFAVGYYLDLGLKTGDFSFSRLLFETGPGFFLMTSEPMVTDFTWNLGLGLEFTFFDDFYLIPEIQFCFNLTPAPDDADFESEEKLRALSLSSQIKDFKYFGYNIIAGIKLGYGF